MSQASANVAIPKEHHRFVIGKNGEKLQELELKTATKIQIPRPDDPSNLIKISGTKEGLEKAKHEILLISAEQVENHTLTLMLNKCTWFICIGREVAWLSLQSLVAFIFYLFIILS